MWTTTGEGLIDGTPEDLSSDLTDTAGDGRWRAFFGDLEGQFDVELQRDAELEIADRVRHERGQLTLGDRLRACRGRQLRIGIRGRDVMTGVADDVGPDWLLVGDGVGGVVVATSAIVWVEGLGRSGRPLDGPRWAVPDLRGLLRALAQSRSPVAVDLVDGPALHGTFAGVFADHADLACHPPGVFARPEAISSVRSIPLGALSMVRRLG